MRVTTVGKIKIQRFGLVRFSLVIVGVFTIGLVICAIALASVAGESEIVSQEKSTGKELAGSVSCLQCH